MTGNERLRAQLAARRITPAGLAERVQVDPKTVQRWIATGRVPHRTHRWSVAQLLDVDEAYLWPAAQDEAQAAAASRSELVALYPHRGQVPPALWSDLVAGARESIGLLVYAGLFWFDANPDLPALLRDRADSGVRVRLALGDPDSPAVAGRGAEEGIDMAARVRMALGLAGPVLAHPGIEVRLHATTLYASIYQADDVLLANTHAYGAAAAQSPVLHLQRVPGGRLFGHYLASFDRVWDTAQPHP